jgi:hypothetical protein
MRFASALRGWLDGKLRCAYIQPMTIHTDWLEWMRDYRAAADRLIMEELIPVSSEDERELVAIKSALYARILSIFDGALLLIKQDHQLNFRIHSRGVIEATIVMLALDSDPKFVEQLKDDDWKSRQSRASLHLNASSLSVEPNVRKALEEFVSKGMQSARSIQLASLLSGSDFERLYRTYRDFSGDAAHVSITSLNRHYVEKPEDRTAVLVVNPELDVVDVNETATELGIATIIATYLLMKVKVQTELWSELQSLVERYKTLVQRPYLAGVLTGTNQEPIYPLGRRARTEK